MREILFRGKRANNGEWEYGDLWCNPYGKRVVCIVSPINDQGTTGGNEVDPETVGQYTGLTDNNGRKIFEGDIIRYADEYEHQCYLESLEHPEEYDGVDFSDMWTIDKVVYCVENGYPAFDLCKHDFEINGLSALDNSRQFYFEVIGNIYDNPSYWR